MAAGHRDLDLRAVLVLEDDGPTLDIALQRWHLQHPARRRADRQERRVGGAALLAQRRQHHGLDGVEPLQGDQQGLVEAARLVAIGGRDELVVKPEPIEEGAQPGIVVGAEAVVGAEGVADHRQRLAEVLGQDLLVRHVVGDLAQAVHVVAERDQARGILVVGQGAEGRAHHGRARHLAEGAHVRQAARAVAGLEDNAAAIQPPQTLQPFQQGARLLERPGLGVSREGGGGGERHARGYKQCAPAIPLSPAIRPRFRIPTVRPPTDKSR